MQAHIQDWRGTAALGFWNGPHHPANVSGNAWGHDLVQTLLNVQWGTGQWPELCACFLSLAAHSE